MNIDEKYELITRNLQEVLGEEELKAKLKSKKDFSIYWGTMPTGSISIAYFFPMLKVADFLKAGCKVKILLADLHALLDSVPWDILERRYNYYREAIILILKTINVDIKKLEFVKGSELQLNKNYFNDLLKLSTLTSVHDSTKAASEAVKSARGNNVKLSGMIYPLMQALDEEYLKVDAQFAGLDQRKIMVYAREYLPKIRYKQRIELMNPMIRGLVGEKMSSSIESTKIDLLDNEETVNRKINKAECVEGNPDNGLMSLLKYLIFVLKSNKNEKFIVKRPTKFGGDLEYKNYEEVEKDFISKKLHPLDLKNAVAGEINILLENFRKNKILHELHKKAYN
jgi:tyrosyl-tRNA synthetase